MSTLKDILTGGAVVAYYPQLARTTGSVESALMLQQIAHWSGYTEDGWVFRTQEQFEEELALSARTQKQARDRLKELEVLEEERRGVPARLYYRINWDSLEEAVSLHSAKSPANSRIREAQNLDSAERRNKNPRSAESINKREDKKEDKKSTNPSNGDTLSREEDAAAVEEQSGLGREGPEQQDQDSQVEDHEAPSTELREDEREAMAQERASKAAAHVRENVSVEVAPTTVRRWREQFLELYREDPERSLRTVAQKLAAMFNDGYANTSVAKALEKLQAESEERRRKNGKIPYEEAQRIIQEEMRSGR